jgi:predicted XRE-type DNA-binding protein
MNTYSNSFDLLGCKHEASLLLKKSNLMNEIIDKINELFLTQVEAAKIMKVTQPRVSDIQKGKISKFSFDILYLMNERIKESKL